MLVPQGVILFMGFLNAWISRPTPTCILLGANTRAERTAAPATAREQAGVRRPVCPEAEPHNDRVSFCSRDFPADVFASQDADRHGAFLAGDLHLQNLSIEACMKFVFETINIHRPAC